MAIENGQGQAAEPSDDAASRTGRREEAAIVVPPPRLVPGPEVEETYRRLRDRALRYLSRGVVHKLNNALAVFSSHVQLMDAGIETDSPSRDARALQDSMTRAGRVLEMLDHLTQARTEEERQPEADGVAREPVCLGSLVRSLGEVLLCERSGQRYQVEVRTAPRVLSKVQSQPLLVTLILVVEHLVETAPLPLPGAVRLDVLGAARRPAVTIGFEIEPGHLPFRLGTRPLSADVLRLAADHRISVSVHPDRPVYGIHVPPAGA